MARPGGEGTDLPVGDWSRELAEAQRMMRDLRSRDFKKHLQEAEAEKMEAQLCKAGPGFPRPLLLAWTADSKCSLERPPPLRAQQEESLTSANLAVRGCTLGMGLPPPPAAKCFLQGFQET